MPFLRLTSARLKSKSVLCGLFNDSCRKMNTNASLHYSMVKAGETISLRTEGSLSSDRLLGIQKARGCCSMTTFRENVDAATIRSASILLLSRIKK